MLLRAALAIAAIAVVPTGKAGAEGPAASFLWFPPAPHVGEPVSLASTSTDMTSPITNLAWDLLGTGTFEEAGPVVDTTFDTPGDHLVRLRVAAVDGSASVATEVIPVSSAPAHEILPFPVVRIAGTAFRSGVRLRLLSVEAPPGAIITVQCRGRGCPVSFQSRVLSSTGVETVTVTFRRLERFLAAGVRLEIRVSKAGEIGKDTTVQILRGRPPQRVDTCLDPLALTATKCPSGAGP
jgi:hypothetical protein